MAARVMQNCFFSFNGVNLSGYLREIELSYEVDEKDASVLGDTTMKSFPGMKKWRVKAKMLQSFAVGEIDDGMFALIGDTVSKALILRPLNSAKSATNPEFTGSGYLVKYPPIAGGVGDLHEVDIEIASASDLVRATA
jgi:hypothetical protein